MAVARLPSFVIDCPDPTALGTFYGALLDWAIDVKDDWVDIRSDDGQCYTPPTWPVGETPQHMHLDVLVDDLDVAGAAVIELGATEHHHQPGSTFRVFLDPAGHPFCLCLD